VADKKPKNDIQFAATVAYYYRFQAPSGKQKEEINKDDMADASRLVRRMLRNPVATLNNAHSLGYLDRGSRRGLFKINTVGENLVTMVLPEESSTAGSSARSTARQRRRGKATRKVAAKKVAKKKSPRKKGSKTVSRKRTSKAR
jgi:hypothetical protein